MAVLLKQFYRMKTADFGWIRIRIVGGKGKSADHLTTPLTYYLLGPFGLVDICKNILTPFFCYRALQAIDAVHRVKIRGLVIVTKCKQYAKAR